MKQLLNFEHEEGKGEGNKDNENCKLIDINIESSIVCYTSPKSYQPYHDGDSNHGLSDIIIITHETQDSFNASEQLDSDTKQAYSDAVKSEETGHTVLHTAIHPNYEHDSTHDQGDLEDSDANPDYFSTLESSLISLSDDIKSLNQFIQTNRFSNGGIFQVFKRLCVILNTASMTSCPEVVPYKNLASQLQTPESGSTEESTLNQCNVLKKLSQADVIGACSLMDFKTTVVGSRVIMDNEIETLKEMINALASKLDSLFTKPGEITSAAHLVSTIVDELEVLQKNMSLMKKHIDDADKSIEKRVSNPQQSIEVSTYPSKDDLTGVALTKKDSSKEEVKLLICIDSNGSYLDRRKFWTLKGTSWRRCDVIQDINKVLDRMSNTTLIRSILISCGAHEINDNRSGVEVAFDMIKTIDRIQKEHPSSKVVVSEVTPVRGVGDAQVKICNRALWRSLGGNTNVIIVKQHNLRDEAWSKFMEDGQHIHARHIPMFAANLKAGLRKAYDIDVSPLQKNKGGRQSKPTSSMTERQDEDTNETNRHNIADCNLSRFNDIDTKNVIITLLLLIYFNLTVIS